MTTTTELNYEQQLAILEALEEDIVDVDAYLDEENCRYDYAAYQQWQMDKRLTPLLG